MIFDRAQGNANVAMLIERKTRYVVLLRKNDRKPKPLMNKLINVMSPLPAEARRSIYKVDLRAPERSTAQMSGLQDTGQSLPG